MAKRTKYNAQKTVVDNIKFDSKAEAQRYGELKILEKAGEIRDLELQPEFQLIVRHHVHSSVVARIGCYRADFRYRQGRQGVLVIEDVKGMKTPLYRWKKKHVEAQYGISIRET